MHLYPGRNPNTVFVLPRLLLLLPSRTSCYPVNILLLFSTHSILNIRWPCHQQPEELLVPQEGAPWVKKRVAVHMVVGRTNRSGLSSPLCAALGSFASRVQAQRDFSFLLTPLVWKEEVLIHAAVHLASVGIQVVFTMIQADNSGRDQEKEEVPATRCPRLFVTVYTFQWGSQIPTESGALVNLILCCLSLGVLCFSESDLCWPARRLGQEVL